jgi:hypothetical protein
LVNPRQATAIEAEAFEKQNIGRSEHLLALVPLDDTV